MKNHYRIHFRNIYKQTFWLLQISNRLRLLMFLLAVPLGLMGQNKESVITVNAVVLSENGEPLSGVVVFTSNADQSSFTAGDGSFSLLAGRDEELTLEFDGYDSQTYKVETIPKTIVLKNKLPKPAQKEEVNLAFKKELSQHVVGEVGYVNTADFSNIDKSQNISDIIDGRISGMFNSFNIRSLGPALLVIDGVPRSRTYLDNMNAMEVEQVTVLKGVHSVALYGEEASNGAVLITTKRGKPGTNKVNTFIETGISFPKRKPNYLGAPEYMSLFNEALANDGLEPRYTQKTIAGTIAQDNPFRYPDIDYYSKEFINDFSTNAKVLTEFSGGKEDTRYYVHMGWDSSKDIVNILDVTDKNTRFNLRANVDFRISEFLTANIDVVGYLGKKRAPNTYYYNTASNYLPNQFAPLLPAWLANDVDLVENANLIDGQYLVGGTSNFSDNVYADYLFSGENQTSTQNFQFNNGLDFDLSSLVEGLSAKTYFSFDYYNQFTDRQQRSYAIYEATWTDGVDGQDELSVNKIGQDTAEPNRSIRNPDFTRNYGANVQINYTKDFGENSIDATLLGYHRTLQANQQLFNEVYNHMGLRVNYDYKDKYIVDYSSAYVTSRKLAKGKRGGLAPTLALGWIASKESFLKESTIIDYLKLNVSSGINKTTNSIGGYYLYEDNFDSQGNFGWNDGGRSGSVTQLSVYGNPNLTYVERKEFNLGIEAVFFKSLGIDANYFNTKIEGIPTQLNGVYTAFLGAELPLRNYNEQQYKGLDLGIHYQKQFGDFSIKTGLTALYVTNVHVIYDEINTYEYQNRQDGPIRAAIGFESLGFFNSIEDINTSPVQGFGSVQPGDIKYKDQNGDGIIDENDQVRLGDLQSDINYGVNLTLKYKRFSLFALGTGQSGGKTFDNGDYFWISGNDKYSEVVRNRWTPSTASTATYPRLSSGVNQNNFRNSDFWMRSSDFFKISRVQLSFDFPKEMVSNLKMKNLGLYLRGSNLFTISKNANLIDLNSNGSLQFRSVALGLVANF